VNPVPKLEQEEDIFGSDLNQGMCLRKKKGLGGGRLEMVILF
jgi:hypothetical protein